MPLYQIEAKLGGELLQDLAKEVSTAVVKVRFFDQDNPTVQRTPDASTLVFEIDPLNTQGKPSEYLVCLSHSTTNGITTLVTVTRGLPRDATFPIVSTLDNANSWDAGTPIGSATQHYNDNLMKAYFEGTEPVPDNMTFNGDLTFNGENNFTGDTIFSGSQSVPVYLDAAARDAAITSPTNGMEAYLTTEGVFTDYTSGAWVTRAAGATPNATELVTGKVRLNTTARTDTATDTDGVEPTVNKPSEIARVIQEQAYLYGVDSGIADAYVLTLIPAATAYVEGMRIQYKAINANTGASTVNVNGLGVKSLVKEISTPLIAGDIPTNQIINAVYDGTNFVLNQVPASLTGGGDASLDHWHDAVSNSFLSDRRSYTVRDMTLIGSSSTRNDDEAFISTPTPTTVDNDIACVRLRATNFNLDSSGPSLHNRNPKFRVNATYLSNTNQDAFIGCVDLNFVGTSLENSALILSHFGFIIEDDTLYISIANGATQSKTDISGTFPTVDAGYMYHAEFDGTTATFWVNNTLAGTLDGANIPTSNLDEFNACVIADATAGIRQFRIENRGQFTYDE